MAETATYSQPVRRYKMATVRTLIWIEETRFRGWGCSECGWEFSPSGAPTGNSLEEMKEEYERLRDKEFAAHGCAEHPKAKKATV